MIELQKQIVETVISGITSGAPSSKGVPLKKNLCTNDALSNKEIVVKPRRKSVNFTLDSSFR